LNLHNLALENVNLNGWGNQTLGVIASDRVPGWFSVGNLSQNLNQYSFTHILGLDQITLDRLQDWQTSFISKILVW
jgi:hypothetical protein